MESGLRKVLVISVGKNNSIELNHAQNEFALLLKEINCEVVAYFSQNIETIERGTYVGVGKLLEVSTYFHKYNEDLVASMLIDLNQRRNHHDRDYL